MSSKTRKTILLLLALLFVIVVAIALSPKSYYSEKHPILDEVRERFSKINPKYSEIPLQTGDKSYTENKTAITLCIVDPSTNRVYDINTIMYVALHELSHIITKADGDESHGEEFKQNFARLIRDAQAMGVYDARQPIPSAYCGIS